MKLLFTFLVGFLGSLTATAEFRTWTRSDGKTAELELLSVSESGGVKSGEFKMKNGRTVQLEASTLSEADAKRIEDWQPPEPAAEASTTSASVFDEALEGNLVKLSGRSLKSCKDFTKPSKYYLFYYTASWCGPCQRFTPSLVDFYKSKKDESFEVVLVTSDRDEDSMEQYSVEKKMPWPQLKLSKTENFKNEFKHPGTGIPNLVLTDLQGNLIKGSYENGNYIGPNAVMSHLADLLKK
jgi:thiol-disulfide isomerase/thioredoxin